MIEALTAIVTVLVLIGAIAIRSISGGRIEVKLTDAIIAAIAAMLVLLVGGKIAKFGVSPGGGLTVETAREAILLASAKPIKSQVSALPVLDLPVAQKASTAQIPLLVRRQVQGLEFTLGKRGYQKNVIKQYLETLTKYAFFQYVIILDENGKFFGMIDARDLLARLQENPDTEFERFTNMIKDKDYNAVRQIPGIVLSSQAVMRDADKRDVLERMEKRGIDWLPVINPDRTLKGVVNRSRVVASLILEVTNQLRRGGPTQN